MVNGRCNSGMVSTGPGHGRHADTGPSHTRNGSLSEELYGWGTLGMLGGLPQDPGREHCVGYKAGWR
jgi:hypothetical protein